MDRPAVRFPVRSSRRWWTRQSTPGWRELWPPTPSCSGTLPPTVTRVLATGGPAPTPSPAAVRKLSDKETKEAKEGRDAKVPDKDAKSPSGSDSSPAGNGFDVLLRKFGTQDELDALAADHRAGGTPVSGFVDVRDDRTLQLSCAGAMVLPYTVIHFADPTKIPLEIVLAAAESAEGKLVTVVDGLEEAAIVFDVLERGSDGILFTPRSADDVFALARLLEANHRTGAVHTDRGEHPARRTRRPGLRGHLLALRGGRGHPRRLLLLRVRAVLQRDPPPALHADPPVPVNAGALHSYVLGPDNRTNYLSELGSGRALLAVDAEGAPGRSCRRPREARVPAAPRHPARSPEDVRGEPDRAGRLARTGAPAPAEGPHVTELRPGDELLGYLAADKRHVGLPIGEFCREV